MSGDPCPYASPTLARVWNEARAKGREDIAWTIERARAQVRVGETLAAETGADRNNCVDAAHSLLPDRRGVYPIDVGDTPPAWWGLERILSRRYTVDGSRVR